MCGIAGFFGYQNRDALERMYAAIAHRGPDDGDIFFSEEDGVGLAHRRLSIVGIDPRGREPIWNEDHTIALVFNGEIYNYLEIKKSLSAHTFFSEMDGEVLIHLYEDLGPKFLDKLNGIFAFVIWDSKKKLLFGARDHLGIKPLYYSSSNGVFVFSSELKALLELPKDIVSRDLDYSAIYYHLRYLWCPYPKTVIKAVRKLEPGHYFILDTKGLSIEKWWEMPIPFPVDQKTTKKEWTWLVWDALRESVSAQLMSDVPLGAFLSGGLDSSAIVACMRDLNPKDKINCYTIKHAGEIKRDRGAQDLYYARKVAKHLNVTLHEVEVSSDVLDLFEDTIFHLDEPIADPAAINLKLICGLAKSQGVKVLLSGAGADDIFSGYRRHQALRASVCLPEVMRKVFGLASGLLGNVPIASNSLRRLKKGIKYLGMEPQEALFRTFEWSDKDVVLSLFNKDVAEGLQTEINCDSFEVLWPELSREPDWLNRQLYLECRHFLVDQNLNYTDKMSMAVGVEVRVPYLDRKMIDLAFKIPPSVKMKGFQTKSVLKEALLPYLPKEVIYRPKTGFGVPLRDWVTGTFEAKFKNSLSASPLIEMGICNRENILDMLEQNRRGSLDASYTVLSLHALDLWLKRFL